MPNILEQSAELRKMWGAFKQARVLLTANNYRIFDHLIKPVTARMVASDLKTDLRATEILLDALAGLGLVKKQKGRYRNSDMASQFLVSGRPYYQGDIIKHSDVLWHNWSGLDEVLKSGKPHRTAHDQRSFILGMHNLAVMKARGVLKAVGLNGVRTALDLGGGPGTYTLEMAKKGITATLFDRPETIEIAKEVISNALRPPLNLRGGVNFIAGDFLSNDFGKGYDLIFISQILHAYSEKENIMVLKKCRGALNDKGRAVIQEFYIDNNRTRPVQSALFSINMLVNTAGGRCYSPDEMKGWFTKAGFKKIKRKNISDNVLVSAEK